MFLQAHWVKIYVLYQTSYLNIYKAVPMNFLYISVNNNTIYIALGIVGGLILFMALPVFLGKYL